MNSEYTYIEFLQAEFTGENLYFQFEITPLGLAPPETKWCKIIFINEMPSHFTCDDRSPSYG